MSASDSVVPSSENRQAFPRLRQCAALADFNSLRCWIWFVLVVFEGLIRAGGSADVKKSTRFAMGFSVLTLGCASWLASASETTTYSYDTLGRLTGSNISGGPNASRLTGTCFDRAGNRVRYDVATAAPAVCPNPAPTPTPS